MNVERLTHLIKVLQKVKADRKAFYMNSWVHPDIAWVAKSGALWGEPCGTACCAFGHAAFDPDFQRQGLALDVEEIGPITKFEELRGVPSPFDITVTFDGKEGFLAAREFFDIPRSVAEALFDPSSYRNRVRSDQPITPDMVIQRVRQVIKMADNSSHDQEEWGWNVIDAGKS